jgi:hypothetical protein
LQINTDAIFTLYAEVKKAQGCQGIFNSGSYRSYSDIFSLFAVAFENFADYFVIFFSQCFQLGREKESACPQVFCCVNTGYAAL